MSGVDRGAWHRRPLLRSVPVDVFGRQRRVAEDQIGGEAGMDPMAAALAWVEADPDVVARWTG